jgi:Glycosyl transferase family 2
VPEVEPRARVTVVIPVWGRYVHPLMDAIASVRGQATPARVIVVDNASESPVPATDGVEVVRSELRLSHGRARNLGLSLVETEYVVFLDADDALLPGALARLVTALDGRPDCAALAGGIVDSNGARWRTPRRLAMSLARRQREFAWLNAVWMLTPTQGCAIMRTAAAREAGGYADASSGEDWALGASLAFRGGIAFDPIPALMYRAPPDSRGASHVPRGTLLSNAAQVRRRLRDDPEVDGGTVALAALATAQAFAALVVHPLARAARRTTATLRG